MKMTILLIVRSNWDDALLAKKVYEGSALLPVPGTKLLVQGLETHPCIEEVIFNPDTNEYLVNASAEPENTGIVRERLESKGWSVEDYYF